MEKTETVAVKTLINTRQLILALGFAVASFAIPFVWGHPQILVGTFVNFLLFASASFLPFELLLPVALMPSVSVLARGLIFGPFTWALIYMWPFIWAGNLVMCVIFKRIGGRGGIEGIGGMAVAAVAKAGFLFLAAFILFNLHVVPKIFLTSFGIMQFVTAIAGGGGWLIAGKIINKKSEYRIK